MMPRKLEFRRTLVVTDELAAAVAQVNKKFLEDQVAAEQAHAGVVAALRGTPVEGMYFTKLVTTAAPTDIVHNLGRIPKGWLVVDMTGINAPGSIWRDTDPSVDRSKILRLKAAGFAPDPTVTVLVW